MGVSLILLLLGLLSTGAKVVALIDAALQKDQAYNAADKRTKGFWLAVLGASLAVQVLTGVGDPIGFFGVNLLGTVAAIVYFVDVRPAVREITRGGSSGGSYGGW